jgi:gliding motility-associated-like protein
LSNIVVGTAPRIIPGITVVRPLCNGLPNGTITASASLGTSPYEYSLNIFNSGAFQTNPIFNNIAAGSYIVAIKDQNNCIVDTNFTVTEPITLSLSTTSIVASTCTGAADGLITVTQTGGTAPFEFSLQPNTNVGWQSSNSFSVVAGNYTITVRDQKGCSATSTAQIALNDTMRLLLGSDTTVCSGSSITLQPQTNALTNVFDWSPGTALNDSTIKNPVASPIDTIQYILVARWGICERRDTIIVNVLKKPIVNAGVDTTICYQTQALLHPAVTNLSGTVNYSWTPAIGVNQPDTTYTTVNPDTSRLYTFTVTDNYGCNFSVSDSIFIKMQPLVPAFAGNDTIAVYNMPHQLLGSGGVGYLWTPSLRIDNPFIANPKVNILEDTYFKLRVTDEAGCVGYDTVFVKVYLGPTYYMPNAFSPNGDGLNDTFRPIPVGIVSTEYFRVFNRYGELVFETNRWLQGWDGLFRGKKQLPGAYIWVIKGVDRNGKIVQMKGSVVLIR